jgi:arylsulfatase A-like enzyme
MFRALRTIAAPFLCAFALGTCSQPHENVDDRSAILITLDTTRFDALGFDGASPSVTPNLDRIAAQGVHYLQARTVAPLTLPAHASMLTGLYPPRHLVRGNGPTVLAPEATTVAERALAAGFQTAGFVGGLTLDKAYGAAQGFETWTQPEQSPLRLLGAISDRPANEVVGDARRWLKARDRSKPFFLWVHVFDAHAPYAPPQPFLETAGGDPYKGEIAAYDAALAELFDDFEREKLLDHATLVVCADHGEGRGDHGEETHGLHAWDTTLRVPFAVHTPDRKRAGEASLETVSVVDVCPTLLDAMHIAIPGQLDGVSLLAGKVRDDRGVYFETMSGWARFAWSPVVGWCDKRGKYIHCSSPQLFDVRNQSSETEDQYDASDERVHFAIAAIAAVLAEPRLGVAQHRTVATSVAQAVAEIGYGGGDDVEPDYPDPLAPNDLPAPRNQLAEYREFEAAQALATEGQYAAAVAKLEPIVAANPANIHALDELGADLVEMHEWRRAVDVLTQRSKHLPDRLSTHRNLVRCYKELGDEAKAREHTLRALELLIEMHERRGEPETAQRYRATYESSK